MKYYSEVLDKVFETQEECESAEKKVLEAEAQKEAELKKAKIEAEMKKKKEAEEYEQYRAKLKEAEEEIKAAYADYEAVKKQASELESNVMSELETTIDNMLTPAYDRIDAALKAKDELTKGYLAKKSNWLIDFFFN